MKPHPLSAETEVLVQAYLEATLTPEQSALLLASLKVQPDLVEVLLEGLRIDSLIRHVVAQTGATLNTGLPAHPQDAVSLEASDTPGAILEPDPLPKVISFPPPAGSAPAEQVRRTWKRPALLALAASVVLFAGLAAWFLAPAVGEPRLTNVQGTGLYLERAGQPVPASDGTLLQSGDLLRTPENVTAALRFAPEDTRITIQPGTELKLAERTRSKRFFLRLGTLEASVARQRPFRAMVIATPQAEARVLGTKFTLAVDTDASTLEVTEGKVRFTRASDKAAVKVTAGHNAIAAANAELAALPATGRILREYWTNLANNVPAPAGSTLKSKRSLVARPDGFDYLQRFESVPLGRGLRFTERIRGYVQPPKTGLYRFALTTVHVETVLLLSRTDRPEDVVQVAFQTPDSGVGPSLQQVTPVPLKAGRKYYVEVVHESDGGDDQLTVSWQAPGGEPEIIPGKFLSPFPAPEKKGQR